MKKKSDPRHRTRELLLQHLYEQSLIKEGFDTNLHEIKDLEELFSIKVHYDKDLFEKISTTMNLHQVEIDNIIQTYAPRHPLQKMNKLILIILRIAILEGFIEKITPPKVAIDEAIEMAKKYSNPSSAKFVGGVLGKVYEEYGNNKK